MPIVYNDPSECIGRLLRTIEPPGSFSKKYPGIPLGIYIMTGPSEDDIPWMEAYSFLWLVVDVFDGQLMRGRGEDRSLWIRILSPETSFLQGGHRGWQVGWTKELQLFEPLDVTS